MTLRHHQAEKVLLCANFSIHTSFWWFSGELWQHNRKDARVYGRKITRLA